MNDRNLTFRGVKSTFNCSDWSQVERIGDFWEYAAKIIPWTDLVGLGFNWTANGCYFDYALGTLEEDTTVLEQLRSVDFSPLGITVEPCAVILSPLDEWQTFSGKDSEVQAIYEKADCYQRKYDYELEYLDGKGNFSTTIHFIE